MKRWWFIIKSLGAIFRLEGGDDFEEEVDLFACALCGSIYMDKSSYVTHYQVNSCVIDKDSLPIEPLELRAY